MRRRQASAGAYPQEEFAEEEGQQEREREARGVDRTQLAANTSTPSGGSESRIHVLTRENCVLMQ